MDMSPSQWSTGCESGWTVYLDDSYTPGDDYGSAHNHSYRIYSGQNSGDIEDSSMVSDASSGPPHFQGDDEQCFVPRSSTQNYHSTSAKPSKKSEKRSKKSAGKEHKLNKHQNQHSYSSNHLDDTASSPAITYSQMYCNPSCDQVPVDHYMGYSQSMQGTHFQGNPSYSNHYSFWESSLPKDGHSAQPGHLTGRR